MNVYICLAVASLLALSSLLKVNASEATINDDNETTPGYDSIEIDRSHLVLHVVKYVYGFIGLVGFLGNALVLYVVIRFDKLDNVTNIYILNLAIADGIFLMGTPFLVTTIVYHKWVFGNIVCKLYISITSLNQFTSSLLLMVMSGHRYVAVCRPIMSLRYKSPFTALMTCFFVWTLSALLVTPVFMYASGRESEWGVACNIFWPENAVISGQKSFTLYMFMLGFLLPLVLILVFYSLIVRQIRAKGPKISSTSRKKTNRKATFLVLGIVTAYVICWMPYWVGQLYITFWPLPSRLSQLEVAYLFIAGCLSYANSAVNPILYAFISEKFQQSFAKAFTCLTNSSGHPPFDSRIDNTHMTLTTIKE